MEVFNFVMVVIDSHRWTSPTQLRLPGACTGKKVYCFNQIFSITGHRLTKAGFFTGYQKVSKHWLPIYHGIQAYAKKCKERSLYAYTC